jgi:polyhydroxybutyrate depolymerase
MKKFIYLFFVFVSLIVLAPIPFVSFAQVQTGSFVFEGRLRNYIVFLPQNYNGTDKLPVVFNIHGYTQNMTLQMNYSRMNSVADSAEFIVVYPNGAGSYNSWNIGVSESPNINDVGFINALIDTLSKHYSIDTTRIYCCGLSMGGAMSSRLACELSNRIAAIAPVAGTMAQSIANTCSPNHSMPVLKIHGTADPILPYNGNSERLAVDTFLAKWANFNLCTQSDTITVPNLDTLDGCTVQKISFTHCSDSAHVILYKIINGGHTWPGGDTNYLHIPGWDLGNTNFDINASEIIWNFFKNYKLTAPTTVKGCTQNPMDFSLFQNYPNPFNPSTKISWQLPIRSLVTLKVYDVLGNEVSTLVNEEKPAGSYEVEFNASNLASGIYFYQLRTGEFILTKKMVLIR